MLTFRSLFLASVLAGAGVLATAPAGTPRKGPAAKPLRVCLVSGAESYQTDQGFADLAAYLQREHGMQCEVLRMSEDQKSIVGIERLLEADTAIFHVRRKTLNDEHLAILRRFFNSGKGFVALRSTSHGWENWKDFDRTVLGAKYGGPGGNNFGNATALHFKPHPIWEGTGANPFTANRDLYRITEVSPDIDVILEGETPNGRVPVAWTRNYQGGRLFYMALARNEEMEQPGFRRAIANALQWVTQPPRRSGKQR